MNRISKTRDLMALCRGLSTESEEREMDSLIESLARITYGSGQRLPGIGKHETDNGTIEDSSARKATEYISSIDNGMESQSTASKEGNLYLTKVEVMKLDTGKTAACDMQEDWLKLDETEKGNMMAMEPRDRDMLSAGPGIHKGNRAREWSFINGDFHDENRRSKKLNTRRKMKEEPSMHFLRSSKSVFNQNRPTYQRTWREEALGKVKLV
ncbi:uncharacterized protein LAJ45_01006 [Morchella importuna]|uniref:uncharacterized protein n=1 Tax=Morchella importuna TaxID=1174673 RepID=UPI001E8DB7E2|nr:uncharacterized protein LAJ45_01006 [Morchella importuna]KAH8154479.1 hypothetical protein LAJ45_01006 [Morchella importuna]